MDFDDPKTYKIMKITQGLYCFLGFTLFQNKIEFKYHFNANLAPFALQKSTKILQKSNPKRHQNLDRFWLRFLIDLGSVLGAKLEPCWPPRRPQGAPGRRQDAPGAPWEAAKTP